MVDNYLSAHASRLAFDVDLVQRYAPAREALLDVGSVPLLLTEALKRVSYDAQEVDIAPERFESFFARLNVSVAKCDIETEKLPLSDRSFGWVIII